ncbi:MAG: RNA methyltransferase, partial [Patescibacteria group bacterium]
FKIKPSISAVKKKKRTPVFVILDNVRSLYNVGSIFRTSDAVLIKKLYLCGITGCPPKKEISKTALGAEELVPFEYSEDAISVIKKLKKAGVTIVAVELAHRAKDYDKTDYKFPICFIFGHEVNGISDDVMKLVDMSVKIPMLGRANSLNVATAYGIIVYDALKKFQKV